MDFDAAVDLLVAAVDGGRDGVPAALARYPAAEWPAIAQHARDTWKREVTGGGGHAGRALRAAVVAQVAFALAGDQARSLSAEYDFLQTQFMLADDPEAYAAVRGRLTDLAGRAAAADETGLVFDAATTAADCVYFAVEALPEEQFGARAAALDALLDDLLRAADAARTADDVRASRPAVFEKFASLTAGAYVAIESGMGLSTVDRAWAPDAPAIASRAGRLRALAAATEVLIPDGYTFGHGDVDKSARAAGVLSRLSADHGSRDRAKSRLRASLDRAED